MRNVLRATVLALVLVAISATAAAAKDTIYVHSATCSPGGTATIQIHGRVDDPSANVSFTFSNAATGTSANTPLGSTDSMDAGFSNTGGPLSPSTTTGFEGQYWTKVTVTCPADACAGDAAVVQAQLVVNGAAVAADTGCVTVFGAKPKTAKVYAPADATASHHHVGFPGTTERVSFIVTNVDTVPHSFLVYANTVNSQNPGGELYPFRPEAGFLGATFIDENLLEGRLQPLEPGDSLEVSLLVETPVDGELGSGNTVNLTVVDENSGAALNGSSVVMLLPFPTEMLIK